MEIKSPKSPVRGVSRCGDGLSMTSATFCLLILHTESLGYLFGLSLADSVLVNHHDGLLEN